MTIMVAKIMICHKDTINKFTYSRGKRTFVHITYDYYIQQGGVSIWQGKRYPDTYTAIVIGT